MVYEIKTLHFYVGLIESFSGGGDVHILHGNDFNSFLTFESCFSEDCFFLLNQNVADLTKKCTQLFLFLVVSVLNIK